MTLIILSLCLFGAAAYLLLSALTLLHRQVAGRQVSLSSGKPP